MRRKSKNVKFVERERKLKLREETELHNSIENSVNDRIYMLVQSEKMTKKEESKDKMTLNALVNDGENHQRVSCVTDNREKKKKEKIYAELLKSGYEKEGTLY